MGGAQILFVAVGEGDPLQACVEVWLDGNVPDRCLCRRLPGFLKSKEFKIQNFKGHNRVDIAGISTGPIWVNMGSNAMVKRRLISEAAAEALKQEYQRRIDDGEFDASLPFITAFAHKI